MISSIIPSGIIIGIMNILGHIGRLSPGVAKKHLIHNRLAYAEYTATHGGDGRNRNINIDSENHGTVCEDTEKRAESQVNSAGYYIENQNELTGLFYGQAGGLLTGAIAGGFTDDDGNISASFNSCEIIACYNAYTCLGREVQLPELIEYFEMKGACLGGAFGSTINAMLCNIRQQGFDCRLCTIKGRRGKRSINHIKAMEEAYSCFILMMWNDGRLLGGIHTVCITRTAKGWCIHNPFGEKDTLNDAIFSYYNADGKSLSKPIALIGLK